MWKSHDRFTSKGRMEFIWMMERKMKDILLGGKNERKAEHHRLGI